MELVPLDNSSCFGAIDGDKLPLVSPGQYELCFDRSETAILFGRAPKLVLWFRVITFGDHFGVLIPRYYNVTKLVGRAQKYGRFKVGAKSDFLREYARLFSTPARLDRIPMSAFEKVTLIGTVRTVTHGANQLPIPP